MMDGLMNPEFLQEQEYSVEADASWPDKEQAMKVRMRQMRDAYNAQFGTDFVMPQVTATTLSDRYGRYLPLHNRIEFDTQDILNPDDWDKLFNNPLGDNPNTVLHEFAHSIAHQEQGSPQAHNENWERAMNDVTEAYGRAMVRAADEAEGVEYPDDWYNKGLLGNGL